jgi:hypothetical protein
MAILRAFFSRREVVMVKTKDDLARRLELLAIGCTWAVHQDVLGELFGSDRGLDAATERVIRKFATKHQCILLYAEGVSQLPAFEKTFADGSPADNVRDSTLDIPASRKIRGQAPRHLPARSRTRR